MKTIYKKLLLLLVILPFSVLAQSGLSGIVTDKTTKQPLPGVNVVIQGSSTGTQTDFDGKFQLPKLNVGDKVLVSYIGYKNQTITYNSQKEVSIALEEESNQLQEVVVQVGYGSVKKKDATGSIALITSKDFNKGSIVSVDQLLTGKAPGVRITNNGGAPDSAPNIRIRQGASLGASNDPLIVIDGVPLSNDNPLGINNPLSMINPNDVESFSILKDASATAIYGIRGSNGVIIITTKKGTVGKPQYEFSTTLSVGKVTKKVDVMTGDQYVAFINKYYPNKVSSLGVPDPNSTTGGRIMYNTDWQDEIFRTSFSTDANFSARANLYNKIPFRASVGYTNNQGLVKTSNLQRLSYSFKLTPKLLDEHLKIDMNAKGSVSDKNEVDEGSALGGAISMDPTKPVYDNSSTNRFGGYYQNLNTISDTQYYKIEGASNPLATLEQATNPKRAIRFLGNIEFDYKFHFLPDLKAVVNLGLDASSSKVHQTYSDNSVATYRFDTTNTDPLTNYLFNPGVNFVENQTSTNKNLDAYLMYSKNLKGFLNKFDIQVGHSYQDFKVDGNKENYDYNTVTGLRFLVINEANYYNRYFNQTNNQAYFGRANLDFANKYLFTITMRTDATSYFAEDKRWGSFPSVGFAWKINDEKFLKDSKLVTNLKLRLGWGKTGNANISGLVGYYPSRPLFTIGNNNSQYLSGFNNYSALAYNSELTWEKTTTYNAGLDFELFKSGLLSGSFDIFTRKTSDLLALYNLPPGQGLKDTFIGNVGTVDSKGFEVALNLKPIQTEKLNLTVNTNLAYGYAEVSDLKGTSQITSKDGTIPKGTNNQLAYNAVGYEPHSAWVFKQIYDSNGQPVVGAYEDLNKDGIINNSDKYYKALRPNWTFGFGVSLSYVNWDFSTSFRGQFGGQVYNSRLLTSGFTERATEGTTSALNNVLDFNNGAAYGAFTNFNGNADHSDYLLEDATFLRCENIVLGYKFTKFVSNSSLRVYAGVNNAFLVTKYSGQDPENYNSIDNNFYPRPRIYSFGLNLNF